jgi:hypothetical protein
LGKPAKKSIHNSKGINKKTFKNILNHFFTKKNELYL